MRNIIYLKLKYNLEMSVASYNQLTEQGTMQLDDQLGELEDEISDFIAEKIKERDLPLEVHS